MPLGTITPPNHTTLRAAWFPRAASGSCSSQATCASFVSRRVRCQATHIAARCDVYGCCGYPFWSHPVWAAPREPRRAHSACHMLMALRVLSSWCRDRLSAWIRAARVGSMTAGRLRRSSTTIGHHDLCHASSASAMACRLFAVPAALPRKA